MSTRREEREAELAFQITAYEKALAAAKEQDYRKAYLTLKEAYLPRDPDEKYNWGVIYYNGLGGVKKDLSSAFEWFDLADNAGSASASRALGGMYYSGNGVEKDLSLAEKYFRKAAEADDGDAQYSLALMYMDGEGVEKDEEAAIEWLKKAAGNNHRISKATLGGEYYRGRNIPTSYENAWYYLKGFENEWFGEHDDCYYYAQCFIGMMYLHGKGTEPDFEKAERCLRRCADHGDSEAQFWLGVMYFTGKGVSRNGQIARSWIKKSAENGFEIAVECLKAENKRSYIMQVWNEEEAKK